LREVEEAKRALDAAIVQQSAIAGKAKRDQQKEEADRAERIKRAEDAEKAAREAVALLEKERQSAQASVELARKALDAARAVESTQSQQIAAAPPVSSAPPTAPSVATTQAGPSQLSKYAGLGVEELTREAQRELQRLGCDPGSIDGRWGERGRAALTRFGTHAKLSGVPGEPSPELLDLLSAQRSQICPLECKSGERLIGGRCAPLPEVTQPSTRKQPEAQPKAAKADSGSSCRVETFSECIARGTGQTGGGGALINMWYTMCGEPSNRAKVCGK
jgi:hypothetical protein